MVSKAFFQRILVRDRIVFASATASLALQIITWGLVLSQGFSFRGEPSLPLHYNIYLGIDLIGPWYGLFLLPAIGLVIFGMNYTGIIFLYERKRILSYLLAVGTPPIGLIILVASAFMVLLNV